MLKNGRYGKYEEKEYRLSSGLENGFRYYSLLGDESDVSKGFQKDYDRYFKRVSKDEIENPVRITTYANYKGDIFGVWEEKGNRVLLSADHGRDLGFKMVEQGGWEKWVDKDDPDLEKIYEESVPLELK